MPINSEFYIITRKNSGLANGTISLQEAYQKGRDFDVTARKWAFWTIDTGIVTIKASFWERRKDLSGVHFRAGSLSVITKLID